MNKEEALTNLVVEYEIVMEKLIRQEAFKCCQLKEQCTERCLSRKLCLDQRVVTRIWWLFSRWN